MGTGNCLGTEFRRSNSGGNAFPTVIISVYVAAAAAAVINTTTRPTTLLLCCHVDRKMNLIRRLLDLGC